MYLQYLKKLTDHPDISFIFRDIGISDFLAAIPDK